MKSLFAQVGDRAEYLQDDLLICSYILRQELVNRDEASISKTRFFKLISNVILDGNTNKYIEWRPHPFGAVPVISAKDGFRFKRDTYLHSPETLEYRLWNFRQSVERGYFYMSDDQKKKIKAILEKNPHRQHLLDGYSAIYSKLRLNELNQLATCRNEERAFWCSNYEEDSWLEKMELIFSMCFTEFIETGSVRDSYNTNKILSLYKKGVSDSAVTARQIITKIETYENNGALLEHINSKFRDSLNALTIALTKSIEVTPLSNRLILLKERSQTTRNITTLVRLVNSAFGIEDPSELSRFEPLEGQLHLFKDFRNPIFGVATRIGSDLKIRNKNQIARQLVLDMNAGKFISAMKMIKEAFFDKFAKQARKDRNKRHAFTQSEFTVLGNISILEFDIAD